MTMIMAYRLRPRRALLLAFALMVSLSPVQALDIAPGQVEQQYHLRSVAAARALAAAEAEARRLGVGVSISIIDETGNLLREARMDGTSVLLIEYARRKAQTSLLFGNTTEALSADPAMARMIGQVPDLLLVPGGIPVRFQGRTVGAIGVSGAAPEIDAQIAQAALAALNSGEKN